MSVHLVISLPNYRVYTVSIWFWPTLVMHSGRQTRLRSRVGQNYTYILQLAGKFPDIWPLQ